MCKQSHHKHAFTLIEVLVVVAIIALLAAILVPSLSRAREQARIASCAANCKQIAGIMATYQSEYKGYLPIMFNALSSEGGHQASQTAFAGNEMLPVAFYNYDKGTRSMAKVRCNIDGTFFKPRATVANDPDARWEYDKIHEFERRLMPDYYACPFGREKGNSDWDTLPNTRIGNRSFTPQKLDGRINAYATWQWEGRTVKGEIPLCVRGQAPGPYNGTPKYSVLSWNFRRMNADVYLAKYFPSDFYAYKSGGGDILNPNSLVMNRHRKWDVAHAQRVKAGSLSDVTVIYCLLGESTGFTHRQTKLVMVRNFNGHRTGRGGGTNTVFADAHVEWVRGNQIGWQ
ncbi:MAG: prepilin-type N-terminal cleavage/methylation domain-containing protein [Planctomycetota bacterium]|nr:MAG: prepilin-type N-terminal cleavage/methylation domain-containing protein [Planctomycetota bacterium]